MKNLMLLSLLVLVAACCKPDEGDDTDMMSLAEGCWGTWQKGSEPILFPTAK